MSDPLSPEEILNRLNSLGKRWPSNLILLSWAGSLTLIDADLAPDYGQLGIPDEAILGHVSGILNDGGDPAMRFE